VSSYPKSDSLRRNVFQAESMDRAYSEIVRLLNGEKTTALGQEGADRPTKATWGDLSKGGVAREGNPCSRTPIESALPPQTGLSSQSHRAGVTRQPLLPFQQVHQREAK
jgi:hypothetical protein